MPTPPAIPAQTPPELDRAAELLEEQMDCAHAAILRFFTVGSSDKFRYEARIDAAKLAARLMHASAAAAGTLQRLRGAPTRHEVLVNRAKGGTGRGTHPQIAKTNGAKA